MMTPQQQTSPRGIPAEEALRTARLDAEKVYRDLSAYRVQIAQEPDGWHVDYELKNKESQGGGPHYVIDATHGTILKKKYEQ